jgi:hypothetical protein
MNGQSDGKQQNRREHEAQMQKRMALDTEPRTAVMGISVANKHAALIKNQARVPNRRTAAKKRQNHLRDHRFNNEQQSRVDEQSYRIEDDQILVQMLVLHCEQADRNNLCEIYANRSNGARGNPPAGKGNLANRSIRSIDISGSPSIETNTSTPHQTFTRPEG